MATRTYIQFIETRRKFPKQEADLLKKIVKYHAGKAGSVLSVPLVNISIYPNSNFTIPETGEGGYTPSKDWFHIYIDPSKNQRQLAAIIETFIPGTVYHEMNHIARWQNTGYGSSLSEAIISEGLAIVFAKEQWEKSKNPWADFSEKEIDCLLDIVRKRNKKNDRRYNHGEWFLGTGKLPRWSGYKLGAYVVGSFRNKNTKMPWNKIMKLSAEKIIKESGVKI